MDACRTRLVDGIAALNLSVNTDQTAQLLHFISLIEKWNKAYNLTAIKNKQDMVKLHLLDSLTVLPYLTGTQIIDVGTGAGLPGIPLAICLPHINFTLLDSNAKKTRFVQQVVLELKLANVQIYHSRAESFLPSPLFDTVISRAFADLADIVQATRHLLTDDGILLAMKGHCTNEEFLNITADKQIIPVRVPGVDAERNLVLLKFNKK